MEDREESLSSSRNKPLRVSQKLELAKEWDRKFIDLTNLEIQELPQSTFELTGVEEILLRDNYLTELPDKISMLNTLKIIDLGYNKFKEFPHQLLKLGHLESLILNNNEIAEIPNNINCMTSLKALHLSYNKLTHLPETISELPQLECLIVHCNEIESLPTSITKLTSIVDLYLRDNKLKEFPSFLLELPKLSSINVQDNLIEDIDEDIKKSLREKKLTVLHSIPRQIITGVYLGDITVANNIRSLKKHNITHIITSSGSPIFPNEFNYLDLTIRNTEDENIKQHFNPAYQFIEDALNNNGNVLVHCVMGVSRSPSLIISYIMRKNKISYDEALELVRLMIPKPAVIPNPGFSQQLKEYEKELGIL